ncbi:MAG: GTPase domain-containing protein [Cyanobacteria bacterium P01_H01_bin.35]
MTDYEEQLKNYLKNLPSPNIAIIGLTGVGKSSLINGIFGTNMATTGSALPTTTKYYPYPLKLDEKERLFKKTLLNVYDSPGYEPGLGDDFMKETFNFLEDKSRLGKEEQIHIVWYIISASAARLTQADKDIIDKINENNIPAIIVLSKCDIAKQEQKDEIKNAIAAAKFSKVYEIVEVIADPLTLPNGEKICKPSGMKELVNLTTDKLPDKIFKDAFIAAQTVDLKPKKELAWQYISEASWTCFAVGALPIPLTAPTSAVAALGYMYNRIIIVYGHTNLKLLQAISGITLGGMFMLFVDGVIDLFSSMLGISILTGGAAATFTAISGMAFTNTCERLAIGELTDTVNDIQPKLREIFKEEFEKLSTIRISTRNDLDKVGRDFIDN